MAHQWGVGGGGGTSSSRSNQLTVTNAYGNGNNRRGPNVSDTVFKALGLLVVVVFFVLRLLWSE